MITRNITNCKVEVFDTKGERVHIDCFEIEGMTTKTKQEACNVMVEKFLSDYKVIILFRTMKTEVNYDNFNSLDPKETDMDNDGYMEVTKELFNKVVSGNHKPYKEWRGELARKIYYLSYDVKLLEIHNYIGSITQYYIQDINH